MADNEEKLVKMLKYVSEHNDFYKNRIKEYGIRNPLDITQWPVLTRKELQENRYNMFSDGYKSKYFNQQLRRQSSSGSTGMPVNVYWDYKDWYASNMCLWRKRHEWYGINPSDKYCVFTLNAFGITPEKDKLYYINEPKNILSFNVSLIRDEHGYEQMAEIINKFRPDWLYIQPFVLNHLICAYENLGIEPAKTIRYIESVGEILALDLRRKTQEVFGVKATNMYGSEEMNGIAYENSESSMYVLTDNTFIEVMDDNNISSIIGSGISIITNLNNFAMPLIRYNQGDSIELNTNVSQNAPPIITNINGRTTECILLPGGKKVDVYTLLDAIANVNNQLRDIIVEFSFLYNRSNNILSCDLRTNNQKWDKMANTILSQILHNRIGENINIVINNINNNETCTFHELKTNYINIID